MKKFTKVVEAYEIENDKYDDFAEEHAKVVISDYLDGKLEGESLQSAFSKMVDDNSLEEGGEDSPQYLVKQALIELSDEILEQANNIQIVESSVTPEPDKHGELQANRKPIGDNPGSL